MNALSSLSAMGQTSGQVNSPPLNLPGLPEAMRVRINGLLRLKNATCTNYPENLPRNCFETAAYASGIEGIGVYRDFSDGSVGEDNMLKLLKLGGYSQVKELSTGQANHAGQTSNLKPGDIIMFGARGFDAHGQPYISYVHAAVYLGQINGRAMIFEKPTNQCGADSPFRIVTLSSALRDNRLAPRSEDSFDSFFVYRQKQ